MTNMRLAAALTLAVLCATAAGGANAQTNVSPANTQRAATAGEAGGRKEPVSELKLTVEEERLVRGSKAAVVATGLSGAYFDEHFRLVQVVNRAGNRQVIWKYSLGEYETTLSDIVGFYTAGGARVDTHSIAGTLGTTYEIRETIPRPRAENLMRECLGSYTDAAVVYQRLSDDGKTGLYLTAYAEDTTPPVAPAVVMPAQPVRPEAQKSGQGSAKTGELVKPNDKKPPGPPFFIGYVNLETGACIKARGIRGQGITR
jgi:hypothetical protein